MRHLGTSADFYDGVKVLVNFCLKAKCRFLVKITFIFFEGNPRINSPGSQLRVKHLRAACKKILLAIVCNGYFSKARIVKPKEVLFSSFVLSCIATIFVLPAAPQVVFLRRLFKTIIGLIFT